jgi:hypothetical protein
MQESRSLYVERVWRQVMAKLTPSQKARAKAMSKKKGVKYPNAWSNLKVARGKKATKSVKKKAK